MAKDKTNAGEQLTLPLWANVDRAAPSQIVRSSLFGIVKKGRRKMMKGEEIASWSGTTITYQGEQLGQGDFDAWLQCLEIAKNRGVDEDIQFEAKDFLAAIGKPHGASQYKWLNTTLDRIVSGHLRVFEAGKLTYSGHLIDRFRSKNRIYLLRINSELADLFDSSYTRILLETRLALKSDLAKWMHSYVSSHRATPHSPHMIGLDKLCVLCGSGSNKREFKRMIKQSMERLQYENVVRTWELRGDILQFVKSDPSADISEEEFNAIGITHTQ